MFPAPAGINRIKIPVSVTWASVPRASGDKPDSTALPGLTTACSPRQRG
ncbi:hypothetical protein MOI_15799 [Escherichia coli P4-NR]|nr:hypothetical protein MOI_15799 [Escherichia coli P4-NR]EST68932.1 hypothetical protein M13_11190 [Escherichia coli P4-96]